MTCVIAISAGSPGTGATTVATGLAIALSRQGHSTCLLDADWGPSSLGALWDYHPDKTLVDLLDGQASLEQVIQQGICGVDIIFGDSAAERMSALTSHHLRVMATQLAKLKDYDYLIIDVAAGADRTVASFLEACDALLLVITDDRKTQDDAYKVVKRLREHKISNTVMAVVNQCRNNIIGSHAYARFREITEFYLQETFPLLGQVCDARLEQHSRQQVLEHLCEVDSDIDKLAKKLSLSKGTMPTQSVQQFWKSYLKAAQIDDETNKRLTPEGTFDSLELQLDTLSERVESLINRVNQCADFATLEIALASQEKLSDPEVIQTRGSDYWLEGLDYQSNLSQSETADHFYSIRQSSGAILRCAYYTADSNKPLSQESVVNSPLGR
jgi:flagellar biosynthesis protein FlhG